MESIAEKGAFFLDRLLVNPFPKESLLDSEREANNHVVDYICCCWSADSLHWHEAASRPANALASLSFPDPFFTPGPACVYRFSDLPSLTAFPADFML